MTRVWIFEFRLLKEREKENSLLDLQLKSSDKHYEALAREFERRCREDRGGEP